MEGEDFDTGPYPDTPVSQLFPRTKFHFLIIIISPKIERLDRPKISQMHF